MLEAYEIAQFLRGSVTGDPSATISRIRPVHSAETGGLAIVFSKKDLAEANIIKADVIVAPPGLRNEHAKAIVEVEKLEAASLNQVLRYYRAVTYQLTDQGNISTDPEVYIGKHSSIGEGCVFMPGVKIMNGVTIGNGVAIHANTVIKEGTIIGDNVTIDSNCSIGNFSFEYMAGTHDKYMRVESVGRVIIQDNVEIGSNNTIDRGTFGDTVIGLGTKIDNQVQIGHDVQIGRHCLIISQVGISGKTVIGDEVILQGQVGIAGNLTIGAKSVIQAKSGVSRSCGEKSVLFGYPARDAREYLKSVATLSALTKERQELVSRKKKKS